jgi:hypothetical protein
MLARLAADETAVIHRLLVLCAVTCCAFVAVSFLLFARDQLAGASKHQQSELVAGMQTSVVAVPIHHAHQQPRKFIDAVARRLTSPFQSVISSGSAWVQEGTPALLALLVYGFGLGYLARFSRGLS